jgi:RNA polymerase sigma factor (sigma-70 family)
MEPRAKRPFAESIATLIQGEPLTRIIRICAKRNGVDWEDLRQGVFIKLLEAVPHTENWQRTEYVYAMSHNCAVDLRRREPAGKLGRIGERSRRKLTARMSRERHGDASPSIHTLDTDGIPDTPARTDEAISRMMVADIIRVLPATTRQVFELRLFECLTFPEIAARTRRPLEQIKSRWRGGIEAIRPSIMKGWL